jgi:hypothetical protein
LATLGGPGANDIFLPSGAVNGVRLRLVGNWILSGLRPGGVKGRGGGETKAAPLAPHTEKKALRDG